MTTIQKIWLGFGTLTVLLAVICGTLWVRIRIIQANLDVQANVARPRSAAARDLETNVLGFALDVRTHLQSAEESFESHARARAAAVDENLAVYRRYIASDRQRTLAEEFSQRWEALKSHGLELISAKNRNPSAERLAELRRLRVRVEEFLESELQTEADQVFLATRNRTFNDLRFVGGLASFLLLSGAAVAVVTSITVGRGILRSEYVIAEQAERLRTTLAGIGDGVITIDLEGRVTNLNPVAEVLTGWTSSSAAGRPLVEIFKIINEDTREPVANPALRALREGVIVGLANHTILIAKDGTERGIDDSAAPIRCKEGQIVGSVLVFRDISERRQLEREKAEQFAAARVLAAIVESSDDAVIGKTLNGVIHSWNRSAERLFGYAAEEACGRPITMLIPPERLTEEDAILARLVKGERIEHFDTVRVRKDGSFVHVSLTISPIKDASGKIVGASKIVRDISERRQSEAELRSREHFLQRINEVFPGIVSVLDIERRKTVYLKGAAAAILGHESEETLELETDVLATLMHPDDRPRLEHHIDNLRRMRDDRIVDFEHYLRDKNGEWRWFHSRSAVFARNAAGEVSQIINTAIDITERRRAEEGLNRNAELFSKIIDQAPAGVYVVDAEFRMRQVSARALPVFATVDPLIGRDFDEVMQILWGPEVGKRCADIFRHTLATGERYISPPFYEQRTDLNERQAFEWETQRVTLPDGQFGVVCYFRDITEAARAEAAIRESDERTRLATEATGVGIWDWNIKLDRVRWDAQMFRLYGVPPTADGFVAYDVWRSAVLPEDLPQQEAVLSDTIKRRGRSTREFRIRRANDGEIRHIRAVEAVRTDAEGNADWVVGTNLDITERKRDEQLLRDNDRRKDEFLATLAHELRNPLAPVRNAVYILNMTGPTTPELQWARDVIDRQVQQMSRLIDDLMDISRINQGKLELKREFVELAKIVQSAVESSRPLIEQCGHQLKVSLPADPIILDADLTRLAQAFLNLLNNAAKYTERGGRIDLRAERREGDVFVSIQDTGIGIPGENLPTIFEMFSQVENALSRSQGGLGIGLSLVKRLVELHGGSITAHSDGPGKGSEFVVRLPIHMAKAEASVSADQRQPVLQHSAQRILVVDDNKDAAASLAILLKIKGNEVRIVHDGERAIAAADDFRPHVVLLDLGLPKLNGYEVCRRIRQAAKVSPVMIAITGWGQDGDRRKSEEAGFDRHLVKPIDPDSLLHIIEEMRSGPRD